MTDVKAVASHKTMKLSERLQNAMSGYLLVDMFNMFSEQECKRRNLPRGSLSMSPQTSKNLQYVAMGIIGVCATLGDRPSPWCQGHLRMTELPIEEHFGRLRVQSASAQLSVRSFWRAAARDMVRQSRSRADKGPAFLPAEASEVLHECDFYEASSNAFASSLRLAAFCVGASIASVEEMYTHWLSATRTDKTDPEESFEDGALDDFLGEELDEEHCYPKVFQHIQEEASMSKDLEEDDLGHGAKTCGLKDLPDLEQMQQVFDAPEDSADASQAFRTGCEGHSFLILYFCDLFSSSCVLMLLVYLLIFHSEFTGG